MIILLFGSPSPCWVGLRRGLRFLYAGKARYAAPSYRPIYCHPGADAPSLTCHLFTDEAKHALQIEQDQRDATFSKLPADYVKKSSTLL